MPMKHGRVTACLAHAMRDGFMAWMFTPGSAGAVAEDWPQFRGVNAAGVSRSKEGLPTELGPETD